MKKIKVSDAIYELVEREAALCKTTIELVVLQKFTNKTIEQFDKKTKDGVLRRVYYYQKKKYGDVTTLKKFLKEWKKDDNFKSVWESYERYDYLKSFMPTFFRHGDDNNEDKLYVATRGDIKNTKMNIDSGVYRFTYFAK